MIDIYSIGQEAWYNLDRCQSVAGLTINYMKFNANHRNPNSAELIFATVDGAEYFDLTQLFISVALPDAVLPGICVSSQ